MGSIRLQNVTRQFGTHVVLDNVSLDLSTSEIVGLVGPNGAGKTTLFRLITGALAPDLGTVTRSKGLEIGYLPQEPAIGLDNTLHDEVLSVFSDVLALEHKMHELSDAMAAAREPDLVHDLMQQYDRASARFQAAGGYAYEQRLREIVHGLGFREADLPLPMRVLSGGQKCRAALAKLLLKGHQYLLLDEPTNHLDIDAVRWLEKFLAGYEGGALVVSHDRYLLDRVAQRIIEVDRARIASYPGNYSNYSQTRATRQLTQERQFEKDAAFIAKERDFIARHLAGQRSQQAKGRRTRLERQLAAGELVTERPRERKTLKLALEHDVRPAVEAVRVEGLSQRFDAKALFENLSFRVPGGARLGITGPNGTGKSTLLKIILGKLAADAGAVEIAARLKVAYFAQEATELAPERTVLAELGQAAPELSEQECRSLLGAFLFSGDDVFKTVGQLSGGEQSRLRLLKLILSEPDLMLLDEPTNHLDIPSREALEAALAGFAGTILVVSHDRYFLDRIVDRLLVLRPEGVTLVSGNYTAYIEQLEREQLRVDSDQRSAAGRGKTKPGAPQAATGAASAAVGREAIPAGRRPKRGDGQAAGSKSPYLGLTVEALEARIAEKEALLAELSGRFGAAEVYKDAEQLARLQTDFARAQTELADLEAAWAAKME